MRGFSFTLWQRSGEPQRGRLEAPMDRRSFVSHGWTSICALCHKTSPEWHSYQSERQLSCIRQSSSGCTLTVLKDLPYRWNTVDKIKIFRRAEWRAEKSKTIKILQPFLKLIKQRWEWVSFKKDNWTTVLLKKERNWISCFVVLQFLERKKVEWNHRNSGHFETQCYVTFKGRWLWHGL